MTAPASQAAVFLNAADLPVERFTDPRLGAISWNTFFSADRTATTDICCGLAHLAPGQSLNLHRHGPAEVYFGVSGSARAHVDGEEFRLVPGAALFIPSMALHGIFADDGPATFFYVFAVSNFAEVDYHPTDPLAVSLPA